MDDQVSSRLSAGISQIGGKFRLLRTVLKYVPYHEFYLEPFLGSAIVLINKPRCRYECGNDLNAELINYLLTIRQYPKEFDELKKGVFGLVSQEICNRIVRGELLPRNDVERAYFFYYLNKLCFGGVSEKGYRGITLSNDNQSNASYRGAVLPTVCKKKSIDDAKANYAGLNQNRAIPQSTFHEKDITEIKRQYKGLQPDGLQVRETDVDKAKAQYLGIAPKNNASMYKGIQGIENYNYRDFEKVKKNYKQTKAQIKGINPKTTRPYTNNDCGLLTPLNPKAIERLRYVNLTCYPFQKVYKMFFEAFHERKGLGEECFLYLDPPYSGTEKYFGTGFGEPEHQEVIEIMKSSPFHCLLSIGGECELYLKELEELTIIPVKVKYSTSANDQTDKQEYLISNYDIKDLPLMKHSVEQNTIMEWSK